LHAEQFAYIAKIDTRHVLIPLLLCRLIITGQRRINDTCRLG